MKRLQYQTAHKKKAVLCRKNKLLTGAIFIFLFLSFSKADGEVTKEKSPGEKPNIIVINADDVGYGDLGCYGAKKVQTPNIDKLAKEGRRFTDAHAASAVCSPSRYGLLTGSYPLRRNFWGPIGENNPLTIDTNKITLASMLKEAGYTTACVGKWHLGFGEEQANFNKPLRPGPLELGFDYFFGISTNNSSPPYVYIENGRIFGWEPEDPMIKLSDPNPPPYPFEEVGRMQPNRYSGASKAHAFYDNRMTGSIFSGMAINWIKKHKDQSFFMYYAPPHIHHPFTPHPRFMGTSQCGKYGDFLHEVDWMVGELLSTLDELGLTENTMVIFTSDNGGMLNQGGQDAWKAGHRLNGKLLGFKFGAWEGGHRVPFIAKWPGKIPADTESDQLISQVDLLATLAEVVDQPLSKNDNNDSVNQLAALKGNSSTNIRDTLLISPNSPSHLVVRRGKWVYIPDQGAGGFQGNEVGDHLLGGDAALAFTGRKNSDIVNGKIREDAPPAQLYNLENDPYQKTNVYRDHPEIVNELHKILESYRDKIGPYPRLGWIDGS